jgi:small subunit ribosomal protein S7
MGRKKFVRKREILPDPKFNDVVLAKFINTLMVEGKRSTAEAIIYKCFDAIQDRTGEEGLKIFRKGLENVNRLVASLWQPVG